MAVVCTICKARMPTLKILEQHMAKRHGQAPAGATNPQIVEPAASTENIHVVEQVGVPVGMVKIVSADGRTLKVSINGEIWEGKEIVVPAKFDSEIRRILKESGYFLMN